MEAPMDSAEQPHLKIKRYDGNFCKTFSSSDVETLSLRDVLDMADEETKSLWENMTLEYTERTGNPLLRKEVAKLHGVDAEEVLIVNPREGVYIAMNILARYMKRKHNISNVHAVSIFPAFQLLNDDLRLAGVHMRYWNVNFNEKNGWHFCLDKLRSLIKKETRILVVNFPHNPTGATFSTQQWEELYQICRSHDIFIFSDEVYRFSENDGSSPPPSACAVYDNAITLFGMSKTLALPGLRIGWLCTKNKEVMECLKKYKDFTTMCSPGPCEMLALMVLRKIDDVRLRTRELIMQNIGLWNQFLLKHSDIFEWKMPKAGTVTLVKLKGWIKNVGGATIFCERAIKEAGLLLIPSSNFLYGENFIRISMARKGLSEALEELDNYLERIKPHAK